MWAPGCLGFIGHDILPSYTQFLIGICSGFNRGRHPNPSYVGIIMDHFKDPYETTSIPWKVYIRPFFFFPWLQKSKSWRIYLPGDPKAFNSATERREARGEQLGIGWGPNTSYKWGEITALKEVITPVSPL